MELPTIKFNIFRKLEYFEQLRKLNQQFWVQFELREKYKNGVFPTWEVEKKILFYTYANHKHLGAPFDFNDFKTGEEWLRSHLRNSHILSTSQAHNLSITDLRNRPEFKAKGSDFERHNRHNRLKDAFLGQNEVINAGLRQAFENLEQRGFAESLNGTQFRITLQGLSFGELLWDLYFPKVDKKYSDIYGTKPQGLCRPGETNLYFLKHDWRGVLKWFGIRLQSLTSKAFYLFAVAFISSQIIEWMGLSTELKDWVKAFGVSIGAGIGLTKSIFIFLILVPVFLFFTGVGLEGVGGIWENKHKKIQRLLSGKGDSFLVRVWFILTKLKRSSSVS